MTCLPEQLSERLKAVSGVDPELRIATKPIFGHFQSNVAMRLAKQEGCNPRQVAQRIVDEVDLSDLCEPLEIAGPGFINIRLKTEVIADAISCQLTDPNVGVQQAEKSQRVVIDYSSPNVAKQMHVGHLRSTIIGDCFNRILSAVGHQVIAQNHIGDWGRQFGMLIEQINDENLNLDDLDLPGAEALYRRANKHLEVDEDFAARARARVVALQSGDEETGKAWRKLIRISLAGFNKVYGRMNVLLNDADVAGESSYNDDLPKIAEDLAERGIAKHDSGALVVFVPGYDAPAIIRNSAGGFGYDATDLAGIRHRVNDLGANRIIYVTDARQGQHFAVVFKVARMAGYLPEDVIAEHVYFGMVLGPDNKPFKTRDGSTVTLESLLDEAEDLAAPDIALAAIKYADLSSALQKDYVFDAARMTQTTGDTGPYLQYAHARCSKILRNAEALEIKPGAVTLLEDPVEQQLALLLTRFSEVVNQVADELTPHKLCSYLYEVATGFSSFYENCPVLKSSGEQLISRLGMVQATRQVLNRGLYLLGIKAPDRM